MQNSISPSIYEHTSDVDSFPLLVSGDPVLLLGDLLILVQDSACLQLLPHPAALLRTLCPVSMPSPRSQVKMAQTNDKF